MKKIIYQLLFLSLISCGFNTEDGPISGAELFEKDSRYELLLSNGEGDADGDRVSNAKEIEQGRNPLRADIPEVEFSFFQDFEVLGVAESLDSNKEEEFSFDYKIEYGQYEYLIDRGRSLVKEMAFEEAARVGRFSGHHMGEIFKSDLSFKRFPKIAPFIHMRHYREYGHFFDSDKFKMNKLTLTLKAEVELKENEHFDEIKNLKVGIYYFDFEKLKWEKIATQLIERHFQQGVKERIEIVVSEVPANLIYKSYMGHGSFIISRIEDYEIPKFQTTYSEFLKGIEEKTLPLVVHGPKKDEVHHLAVPKDGAKLVEILKAIYGKAYKVENDELFKIGEFENNLPTYNYLSELRDHDKKGRWFILSNKLNRPLLDYSFNRKEILVLSYITGKQLSSQLEVASFVEHEKVTTQEQDVLNGIPKEVQGESYFLGKVTNESALEVQLYSGAFFGDKFNYGEDQFNSGGSCGRNCRVRQYRCDYKFNIREEFSEALPYHQFMTEFGESVSLVIGLDEFTLMELYEKKLVELYRKDKKGYFFRIPHIKSIKKLSENEEVNVHIKVSAKKRTVFDGIWLHNYSGPDWPNCVDLTIRLAADKKWPISTRSKGLSDWSRVVNWNVIKRGVDTEENKHFEFKLNAVVRKFYN